MGIENSVEKREQFLTGFLRKREEGVLLQTCNRVEWYSGKGVIPEEISRHLFRVVSGLESAIIGKTAIVNQFKQAYREAAETALLDKSLHKLFQTALSVGKRVRRETGISREAMSYSQAAVQLIFPEIGQVNDLNITVIGVNALNEKIIKFFVNKGAKSIFLGNRTFEKVCELAGKYDAIALRFDSLPDILEKTDVLVSATAAPHLILKKGKFNCRKKMYIVDLAVPRDIDPLIGELPNVSLYDIETIEKHVQQNIKVRSEKVMLAEDIIQNEVQLFSKKP